MSELMQPAATCAELFAAEGLPAPPLPQASNAHMVRAGDAAFASEGWPAGLDFDDTIDAWLSGSLRDGAWAGFAGHGAVSLVARVMLAGPALGLFMQRPCSGLDEVQLESQRTRIAGAFGLMRRIVDTAAEVQAAGRWPQGKRLALIDDGLSSQSWGWVDSSQPPTLVPDTMSYLGALGALEQLLEG